MRPIWIPKFGPPEVLELREVRLPEGARFTPMSQMSRNEGHCIQDRRNLGKLVRMPPA